MKTWKNCHQKFLLIGPFFFTAANQPKTSPNLNFYSIKICSPHDLQIMTLVFTHFFKTLLYGVFFIRSDPRWYFKWPWYNFWKKNEPNLENCSLQRVLIMLLWTLRVRKIGLKMKGSPRLAGPGLVMWPKFRSGLGSPRNLRYGFFKLNLCFSNPYFLTILYQTCLSHPYFIKPMFFQLHILTYICPIFCSIPS